MRRILWARKSIQTAVAPAEIAQHYQRTFAAAREMINIQSLLLPCLGEECITNKPIDGLNLLDAVQEFIYEEKALLAPRFAKLAAFH